MKNITKKAFVLVILLLCSVLFAEEDYNKAVSVYKNFPSNTEEEVHWEKPYDETYLPYNRCGNVQDLEIMRVDERADYYWDGKDGFWDLYHY